MKQKLDPESLCQVGIVVKDIKTAVKLYSRMLNTEEPGVMLSDPVEKAHTLYRGKPTDAQAKMAFFNTGTVQVELIEPVGGKSTWKDHLKKNGSGIHHIAFKTDDADAVVEDLKKQGIEVVQQGDYPGGRYVYLDAIKTLGIIVELLQDVPVKK